ncbi:MAG: sulfatase [Phycisphaerae bacterium]
MSRKTQPNILFFLPDQHRPDWLGANGQLPLRTPNLDQLCARGTRFTKAYTPSPVCAPARACLASGRNYDHCRVPSNKETYPLDQPTYYQRLQQAGYHVCGVGKFDLHKDLRKPREQLAWHLDGSRDLEAWGFDEGIDNEGKLDGSGAYSAAGRPKGPYLNFLHQRGLAETYCREHAERMDHADAYVTALPDDAYCDNWIAGNGLRFLRDFPTDRPWHLVINFTGPHNPMDVTRRMHEAWNDVTFPPPIDNDQQNYSDQDHQRNRQHYAAEIENIDRQVGRFLELLGQRGEMDNTLIVFSSDHGEMLGDHGLWGKSTWYEPSVGIPLIVAGPDVRRGEVSDALVCLHDLAATFLKAAEAEPLPDMDARNLWPILHGNAGKHRETIYSALGKWRMLTDGRWKLVTRQGEGDLLFDLQTDPLERRNQLDTHPDIAARLGEQLQRHGD